MSQREKKAIGHRKLKFSVDQNNFWIGIRILIICCGESDGLELLLRKTSDYEKPRRKKL